MEISITAVSKNRGFTKALVRHSNLLAPLRRLAEEVDTTFLSFDILQMVFTDGSQDALKIIGCRSDRLFQVEVPIPSEGHCGFQNADDFAKFVAKSLGRVLHVCGLQKDVESRLLGLINVFQCSL